MKLVYFRPLRNYLRRSLHRKEGQRKKYRLKNKLTKPYGQKAMKAKVDLPNEESEQQWKTVTGKNGPQVSPLIKYKQTNELKIFQ